VAGSRFKARKQRQTYQELRDSRRCFVCASPLRPTCIGDTCGACILEDREGKLEHGL